MAESLRERAPRYHRRVLTLGAVAALAVFVVGAPIYNSRIESDLERRVPEELAVAGFSGVSASFDGQDGTLRCDAPLADPEGALDVAYAVWGVRKIEIDRGCRVRTAPTVETTVPDGGDATDETSAASGTPAPTQAPAETADFATVVDIVTGSPELSLFADLLQGAEITERLMSDEVTLFAPSDDAFDNLPADVLADLREDPDRLAQVLAHHVVEGRLESTDLESGPLTTSDGGRLEVDATQDVIVVDTAAITAPDMVAANGVVHVIDQVLVPNGVSVSDAPEPERVSAAFDEGTIVLNGVVATEVERAALVDAATTVIGIEGVDDRLTVDPDTGLDATTVAGLAQLVAAMPVQLVRGASGFDGADLFITGQYATDEQRDAVIAIADQVGAMAELEQRPEATETDAADLEDDLNEFAAANPILFEPGSAVLTESADSIIAAIARRLVQFDGVSVTVEGHTDSDGTPEDNLTLSQLRAAAVVTALVDNGVDPTVISAEGFGSEQPILVDGVEDKEASRRVEFRVEASE